MFLAAMSSSRSDVVTLCVRPEPFFLFSKTKIWRWISYFYLIFTRISANTGPYSSCSLRLPFILAVFGNTNLRHVYTNFPPLVSIESPSNISPNPSEVITEVSEPLDNFSKCPTFPPKKSIVLGVGVFPRTFLLIGILIFLLLRSPFKIS